jgi:DNA-binding response OmpR family regulator
MMPEKDGYQVCDELKNNAVTSHIPIILLTAKTAMESKLTGLRSGADDYLTKPFHTEELIGRIENLIESRRILREKYAGQPAGARVDTTVFPEHDQKFLQNLTRILESNLDDDALTVEDFAKRMFISRVQLHRKLKALTAQNATDFIRDYRLDRAMELLKNKQGNVTQVAGMVGFGNEKYFSTVFKEKFGISPSQVL